MVPFCCRVAFWSALLGCLCNGCTLIGAGVGAALDSAISGPYEDHAVAQRIRIKPGDRIRLGMRNGHRVEGKYLGSHSPTATNPETYLVIEADDVATLVPASDLRTVGTETVGKGWLYGCLIGLAVDVTVVVATIVALGNMKEDFKTLGGDSGCFC